MKHIRAPHLPTPKFTTFDLSQLTDVFNDMGKELREVYAAPVKQIKSFNNKSAAVVACETRWDELHTIARKIGELSPDIKEKISMVDSEITEGTVNSDEMTTAEASAPAEAKKGKGRKLGPSKTKATVETAPETTEAPVKKRGRPKKVADADIPDLPTRPAKVVKEKAEKIPAAPGKGRAPKYADDMHVYQLKTAEEAKRHKYWALYEGEPTVKEVLDRYLAAGASLSIARLQLTYESLTGFIAVR